MILEDWEIITDVSTLGSLFRDNGNLGSLTIPIIRGSGFTQR